MGLGEEKEDWALIGDITPEEKGGGKSQLPKQEIEERRKWVRDPI